MTSFWPLKAREPEFCSYTLRSITSNQCWFSFGRMQRAEKATPLSCPSLTFNSTRNSRMQCVVFECGPLYVSLLVTSCKSSALLSLCELMCGRRVLLSKVQLLKVIFERNTSIDLTNLHYSSFFCQLFLKRVLFEGFKREFALRTIA